MAGTRLTDPTHFAVTARQLIGNLKPEGTDMTTDQPAKENPMTAADRLNLAEGIAPVPASRDQATREAWIRHYAAQAVAAHAAFRQAIRTLPRGPEPGSRPELGYLIALAVASTAAAAALVDAADAP